MKISVLCLLKLAKEWSASYLKKVYSASILNASGQIKKCAPTHAYL